MNSTELARWKFGSFIYKRAELKLENIGRLINEPNSNSTEFGSKAFELYFFRKKKTNCRITLVHDHCIYPNVEIIVIIINLCYPSGLVVWLHFHHPLLSPNVWELCLLQDLAVHLCLMLSLRDGILYLLDIWIQNLVQDLAVDLPNFFCYLKTNNEVGWLVVEFVFLLTDMHSTNNACICDNQNFLTFWIYKFLIKTVL